MALQAIQLWGHWGGPNPWKICIILEALCLPYDHQIVEFNEVKGEAYTKHNPNGRLPTIHDPNTGITLWESGAIVQYLIEQYDKDGEISCQSFPEKHLAQQWLAFQISGQGPYVGQAAWFARFHAEKIPSAIDRYVDETIRIAGVLEEGLKRNGTGWLVGGKCTYADLVFVTWAKIAEGLLKELHRFDNFEVDHPLYSAWLDHMASRPEVSKVLAEIAKARSEHGLPP